MPPALDSLPALRSDGTLAVTGQAEPGQSIRVYVNGGSAGSGVADGTGAFSIPVALPAGTNDIHAVSYSGTTDCNHNYAKDHGSRMTRAFNGCGSRPTYNMSLPGYHPGNATRGTTAKR